MAIEHKNITGDNIHEPKGVDTATIGQVYISDGNGSGVWTDSIGKDLASTLEGKVFMADGSGSGSWVYLHGGWGFYKDDTAEQTFNTTATKLTIDGAGSISESGFLPRSIRGTGELWDTTNNLITPVNVGDGYNLRLDLPITTRSSANYITLELDIGGAATPTIVIVSKRIDCNRPASFNLSTSIPIFCLNTFVSNGGQIFLSTDSGSVGITAPSILISQSFDGTH